MSETKPLLRQVERLLDEATGPQLQVIVQMERKRGRSTHLVRAAGEALSRRRFSLTPRDLLPVAYEQRVSRQERQGTASTRTLLGKATSETLELARIQKVGLNPTQALLDSGVVQSALGRLGQVGRKSTRREAEPTRFWTSGAMALTLARDDVKKLADEVEGIKAIHVNRRLNAPATLETRPLRVEEDDVLVSTWGLERIQALAAWGAHGARGQGVTIGLLDTGIDASHPDLQGRITHWEEFDSLGQPVGKSKPHDSDEHGTHCAGTLVGGNTSGRFIGVAPEAKIAAALVLNGEQGGTDAQILAGIDWAVEQGADVISLSLGGLVMDPETPAVYTEALLTCVEAGIPVVAAIGNEGQQTTGSPGSDLFALSIGATDPRDRVAGFSGGRTQIIRESDYIDPKHLPLAYSKPDLSAPGVAITSCVPGGKWKAFNGTSMAAPHVAGAIALLLSATTIREKESGAHRAYVIQDLIIGAVEDLGESGQDHRYGFGRLDVLRAIDFAKQRGY